MNDCDASVSLRVSGPYYDLPLNDTLLVELFTEVGYYIELVPSYIVP
jgi:hypothetical protein